MGRSDPFDSGFVKAIALFISGGVVSLGVSAGLVLYVWSAAQTRQDEDRAVTRANQTSIHELRTKDAVFETKLDGLAESVKEGTDSVKRIETKLDAAIRDSKK